MILSIQIIKRTIISCATHFSFPGGGLPIISNLLFVLYPSDSVNEKGRYTLLAFYPIVSCTEKWLVTSMPRLLREWAYLHLGKATCLKEGRSSIQTSCTPVKINIVLDPASGELVGSIHTPEKGLIDSNIKIIVKTTVKMFVNSKIRNLWASHVNLCIEAALSFLH